MAAQGVTTCVNIINYNPSENTRWFDFIDYLKELMLKEKDEIMRRLERLVGGK
jgi:hypothetical protein